MAKYSKTYSWISLWFLVTTPLVLWDAGFCFMRPRSFVGGDLHWIWKPYHIYQNVDLVYGVKAYEEGHGFASAQSLMNIIETLLNLYYLYLAHISDSASAPLVGFSGALMTLSKTLLYWAQEYYCNFCAVGHNSVNNLILYWILPNGFWILFPTLIVIQLGKDLVSSLQVATKAKAQ